MSEEMHPSAGSGRDPESQKNILRKLINTMKEGHKDDKEHRKADFAQSVITNHLLESILDQKRGDSKDAKKSEQSKKGDDLEAKREQKGMFAKFAKMPSFLKSDDKKKSSAGGGGILGMIGKTLKGGLIGGGAILAGAGLLAGGAGMFLNSLKDMDVDKVKENVKGLLSIQDDFGGAGNFFIKGGTFVAAMTGIGLGLAVFSAGSGVAGMTDALLTKYNSDWTSSIKENVVTLLSISDELGGNVSMLADSGTFLLAMTGIAAGLAVFGLGSAVAGVGAGLPDAISKFSQGTSFSQSIKDNVLTLLSIKDELGGNVKMLAESGTFLLAMTGIGAGLAVFGAGSAVAGISDALTSFGNADWASSIKANVLTLLSIGDAAGGNVEFLKDSAGFLGAMTGIAAGLAVFGVGAGISRFMKPDMGESIKSNVLTLLSLTDQSDGDIEVKSTKFKNAMGNISDGLKTFTAGNLASALGNVGVAVLNFLSGGDNKGPIQEMLSIAEKEVELNKAASGIERMASALERVSGINIGAGSIDIEGMLDSFGHLPRLLGGLAHGNPAGEDGVEFETSGFNKKIDFGKGILDPNLKVPEISKVMTQVNSSLGLGAPRNAQMSTVQGQNTELTGTGTGGTTVMDASTNVQNNTSANSTAIYGDATPATNSNDGLARVAT